MATEGKTISWNKKTNTGWKYVGGRWIQYRSGEPTGRTSKTRLGTTALSTLNPNQYKNSSDLKVNTQKPQVKSVGTVDFNVNTASGLAAYNKALKASKNKKTETPKSNGNKKAVNQEKKGISKKDAAKKRWIKNTETSPAAKGGFSGEERYALHKRHEAWKAARKAGTLGDWEKKYHPNRPSKYTNKKKAKIEKTETKPNKNKLTIKEQHKIKLNEQQNETAKIMQNDSRYKGPEYKKKKKGG
tara:strand:+ start:1508 stop:2236 length:729 start_codon:yes stop_codon:yes gene_type:complete